MGERRVSGWFILSAVFVVLVFGLFFTFTERKTWPEHKVELGPMDMRLVPPVSTLWCEAVALHSDHYFVAYHVNHSGQINPLRLTSQIVRLGRKKLGRSWSTNFEDHKYFLLPASVMGIIACSSSPAVKLLIFEGDTDVLGCLQRLHTNMKNAVQCHERFSKIMDYDSYEDYSDENDIFYSSEEDDDDIFCDIADSKKECSSLLHYDSIDLYDDEDSSECNHLTQLHPVKMNISTADYYTVVLWNTNPNVTNYVNLRVMLDRTRYVIQRSGQPLDICSLSNSCTIGLSFASGDRVLVTVPEETNAGRSTVVVRSRCKPRLAIFAVLSVFLPLLMFLAIAFVVRTDNDIIGNFFRKRRDGNDRVTNNRRAVAPLLDHGTTSSFESLPSHEVQSAFASVQIDDMPPPYHTLYDPPPPYACVKDKQRNNDRAS